MRTWISRNLIAISTTLAVVPLLHAESAGRPPSQEEIDWAIHLESKFKQNYMPTPQEIEAYRKLSEKLTSQPTSASEISVGELKWALALEEKVKSGYQPISAELKAYQALSERLSKPK